MSARILLVCGPATGGLRTHVAQLATWLHRRGWGVAAAVPHSFAGELPGPRFPFPIGDHPHPARDLRALARLQAAVAVFQPNLVHAHGAKAALAALSLPARAPVVVTLHNEWRGGPLTVLLRLLLRRARGVVCVSDAVRSSLLRHGIRPVSDQVIRNGVDLDHFQPRPALPEGPPTAAFVGRLAEEKGVRALCDLAARAGPVRLLLAGEGPLRELVAATALRYPKHLHWRGAVADPRSVYRAVHLLVAPSLTEGLPLAPLEAMACGLPVVATAAGGLREVVEHGKTGLLVPPGDPAALLRALERVGTEPELNARMGSAARRRVEEHFSLEHSLSATERMLLNCLL